MMKGAGKTLVVLRFSALGDVAMTLPVIYSVARQWPGLKIYVAIQLSGAYRAAPQKVFWQTHGVCLLAFSVSPSGWVRRP